MNDIEKAEKALLDFLKEHPEMQTFQDRINALLAEKNSPEDRMKLLSTMMSESLLALQENMKALKKEVTKALPKRSKDQPLQ